MDTKELVRIARGMEDLDVRGVPSTKERAALIEEAIASIQADGREALQTPIGMKNYASFGDQRFDGTGSPRHGSIVFRIERKRGAETVNLGTTHIFALEALRDAEPIEVKEKRGRHRTTRKLNLFRGIELLEKKRSELEELEEWFQRQEVESYLDVTP